MRYSEYSSPTDDTRVREAFSKDKEEHDVDCELNLGLYYIAFER